MIWIKHKVSIFIILLTLLLLSIFLTINSSPLYYWIAIDYFHLNSVSGLNGASLMKCYFFMLKYLQVPWNSHLNLIFFRYSSKGLVHFRDVRHLVLMNNFCLLILGGLSIHIIRRWKRNGLMWMLINPLKASLTGGLIFISIVMINFQAAFIKFHQIMFRNRDWVFNAYFDPIIKVLPTSFFAWCFIGFVAIISILIMLMINSSK